MSDDPSTGDPIPDVFDPDRIDARFVVAMSMARNDIEISLRDGIAAGHDDRPDFAYRVRLVTSHLVEALDSLNAYSQEEDVKKLLVGVPADAKKGAVAFKHWADALVVTYLDATGGYVGTPRVIEDGSAPPTGDDGQ